MRAWIICLLPMVFLSCMQISKQKVPDQKVLTYTEILKCSLETDTLQQYYYRLPDGTPYPLTVVDEILSSCVQKPEIMKFGHPVMFISKGAADSANLKAYFWVIDYQQLGNNARIQLEDPIRHILFGASYTRTPSGWRTESIYLEQQD